MMMEGPKDNNEQEVSYKGGNKNEWILKPTPEAILQAETLFAVRSEKAGWKFSNLRTVFSEALHEAIGRKRKHHGEEDKEIGVTVNIDKDNIEITIEGKVIIKEKKE